MNIMYEPMEYYNPQSLQTGMLGLGSVFNNLLQGAINPYWTDQYRQMVNDPKMFVNEKGFTGGAQGERAIAGKDFWANPDVSNDWIYTPAGQTPTDARYTKRFDPRQGLLGLWPQVNETPETRRYISPQEIQQKGQQFAGMGIPPSGIRQNTPPMNADIFAAQGPQAPNIQALLANAIAGGPGYQLLLQQLGLGQPPKVNLQGFQQGGTVQETNETAFLQKILGIGNNEPDRVPMLAEPGEVVIPNTATQALDSILQRNGYPGGTQEFIQSVPRMQQGGDPYEQYRWMNAGTPTAAPPPQATVPPSQVPPMQTPNPVYKYPTDFESLHPAQGFFAESPDFQTIMSKYVDPERQRVIVRDPKILTSFIGEMDAFSKGAVKGDTPEIQNDRKRAGRAAAWAKEHLSRKMVSGKAARNIGTDQPFNVPYTAYQAQEPPQPTPEAVPTSKQVPKTPPEEGTPVAMTGAWKTTPGTPGRAGFTMSSNPMQLDQQALAAAGNDPQKIMQYYMNEAWRWGAPAQNAFTPEGGLTNAPGIQEQKLGLANTLMGMAGNAQKIAPEQYQIQKQKDLATVRMLNAQADQMMAQAKAGGLTPAQLVQMQENLMNIQKMKHEMFNQDIDNDRQAYMDSRAALAKTPDSKALMRTRAQAWLRVMLNQMPDYRGMTYEEFNKAMELNPQAFFGNEKPMYTKEDFESTVMSLNIRDMQYGIPTMGMGAQDQGAKSVKASDYSVTNQPSKK
jgi:hypothetical protein